jgi:hypothetical protein
MTVIHCSTRDAAYELACDLAAEGEWVHVHGVDVDFYPEAPMPADVHLDHFAIIRPGTVVSTLRGGHVDVDIQRTSKVVKVAAFDSQYVKRPRRIQWHEGPLTSWCSIDDVEEM